MTLHMRSLSDIALNYSTSLESKVSFLTYSFSSSLRLLFTQQTFSMPYTISFLTLNSLTLTRITFANLHRPTALLKSSTLNSL
jgi:hypothetical protein